eukprot:1392109-Amorphochlora_amoeboformis.AAC.1
MARTVAKSANALMYARLDQCECHRKGSRRTAVVAVTGAKSDFRRRARRSHTVYKSTIEVPINSPASAIPATTSPPVPNDCLARLMYTPVSSDAVAGPDLDPTREPCREPCRDPG